MIFYFSGTGNSLHAAKTIAQAQDEELISIADEMDRPEGILKYQFKKNEVLGFVYPVYAWGPPKFVLDFIKRQNFIGSRPYVFSLSTCGAEEGNATSILNRTLIKKGLSLDSAFTLVMPNNYIFGFDVDSKEVVQKKLYKAEQDLETINSIIKERKTKIFRLVPGSFPNIKTKFFYPMLYKYPVDTGKFYATDTCTGCGLCQKICPIHTITVTNKPSWGKECLQCLACIHHCPEKAIQYGKGTLKKGRYVYTENKDDINNYK